MPRLAKTASRFACRRTPHQFCLVSQRLCQQPYKPVHCVVSSLDAFSFLPSISHVMSISCQLAERIFGAWELAAGGCRAQWEFCPTLSLREPSRRGKYPDRNKRLGPLALSFYQ